MHGIQFSKYCYLKKTIIENNTEQISIVYLKGPFQGVNKTLTKLKKKGKMTIN